MDLFIVRHAEAEPRRAGRDDARRALTEDGERRWRRSVAGLERLEVKLDHLLHSPWLRAVQTADALAKLLDGESAVTENLARAPGVALLKELKGERVAVVGHEPWLSQLLAWLVLGREEDGARFELKKGAVAWLEGRPSPGGMVLKALLTPKALRAMR